MVPEILTHILTSVVHIHKNNMETEQRRIQLRALEMQIDHDYALSALQASLARDFIHAVIERRIDAIQSGFETVFSHYAEQARHYMQQQDKYSEADIRVSNPLENAKLQRRMSEIDRELSSIRIQSQSLYQDMSQMLIMIGASIPTIPTVQQRVLQLPQKGQEERY